MPGEKANVTAFAGSCRRHTNRLCLCRETPSGEASVTLLGEGTTAQKNALQQPDAYRRANHSLFSFRYWELTV